MAMSLGTLVRKARQYHRKHGTRDTLQMSRRYATWRLRGMVFLLHNRQAISDSGSALKIRGNVALQAGSEGSVSIGDNVELVGDLGRSTFFKVGGNLKIADEVFVNRGCEIHATTDVILGYDATLAPGIIIRDSDMHAVDGGEIKRGPVKIGRGAWLGTRSIILKGVTVGTGAVVGAGSVVTNDVPPKSVVAGNPARVIREI